MTNNHKANKIIVIPIPNIEKIKLLIKNNNGLDPEMAAPQFLFFITLLNELEEQIPNFKNKRNKNLNIAEIFAISWREASTEYTDEFVILANKLGLLNIHSQRDI